MNDVLRSGRHKAVRQAAYRLADTGHYADWHAIALALCDRYGVLVTHRALVGRALRTELNLRCAAAQEQEG